MKLATNTNMFMCVRVLLCESRYLYASTACVYNESLQLDPANPGLKEADAWPARPQDTYGLEKLYHEEMCIAYAKDFPIKTRMARFHNVYGEKGTFKVRNRLSYVAACVAVLL
jgi:GDP-D-mannose 3', 5'-epimerase